MRSFWLLYDDADFALNRDYAALMRRRGLERGLSIEPVVLSELLLGMHANGKPYCLRHGAETRPDGVFSRQRDALISRHFELMGAPVFNGSSVCALCNDKRATLQLLAGLPMPETLFLPVKDRETSALAHWPVIVKPARGHGGDRVTLARDAEEWRAAADAILPQPALEQHVVSGAGRDLRVYIVFGEIIAGVMRTARNGVVSNFKLGGHVALHTLSAEERALTLRVLERFQAVNAPLCFAGVDLLYDGGQPVVGEVEDVVGSRMLYQTSDIDIVSLFLDGVLRII